MLNNLITNASFDWGGGGGTKFIKKTSNVSIGVFFFLNNNKTWGLVKNSECKEKIRQAHD